ncbi:hypothetical protein [Breznakiella homolactica]|uniref:ABC transporter permease n=1 Tax=Breznakiella homolactica TaxID=2798577 RepID=A0A7T8BDE2_9SPIR|nr:hypothetical protein [Breznakiella homolactica]QQO11163.1 hypothetical protein JFL75_09700 [Breznakiella homolactica]
MNSDKQFRSNTIKVLTKYFIRNIAFRFESWFLFVSVLLIFSGFTINALRSVAKDMFIVTSNIYEQPIFAGVLFVCVFSSFLQMLHISRDIDSRIYESYLYGPVDESSYIISIFVSYSLMNCVAVFVLPLLWITAVYLLAGIPVTAAAVLQILIGYVLSNLILTIAMCIGALAKKSKLALWYLLLFHVVCIGIILGNTVISTYLVPVKRTDVDVFSFFRVVSQSLYDASVYFSPYTQFYILQKNFSYGILPVVLICAAFAAGQVLFGFLSRWLFKRSVL